MGDVREKNRGNESTVRQGKKREDHYRGSFLAGEAGERESSRGEKRISGGGSYLSGRKIGGGAGES